MKIVLDLSVLLFRLIIWRKLSNVSFSIMQIEIYIVSVYCSTNAVGKIIHQMGFVVGFRHQVLGQVVQHVLLVRLGRVLEQHGDYSRLFIKYLLHLPHCQLVLSSVESAGYVQHLGPLLDPFLKSVKTNCINYESVQHVWVVYQNLF